MANLSEDTLLQIVNSKCSDAKDYQSTIFSLNSELERRYNAEYYGTEVPGRSRFVSNDVKDAVESAHTSLVRMFLGAGSIITFLPQNPDDKDQLKEAQDKTLYIDWLIRGQTDSYKTQNGFIKEVLKFKAGYQKYYYQETETTEDHSWTGISAEEVREQLDVLVANRNNKDLKLISSKINERDEEGLERSFNGVSALVAEQDENEDGTFDIKVRVKVRRQEIKIIGVPTGSFLLSSGADNLDEAELVGDESFKTRGELIAEGHSKKLVSSLPSASINGSSSRIINADQLGEIEPADFGEWASQSVPISDLYVLVDYNQDGIAERRNIQKSGEIILVNEPFNHVPYVAASSLVTPHRAIGEGWAEQVTDIAEVNTAITRGVLDNIYSVNNVKKVIRTTGKSKVNIDEAMSNGIGGIIQASGERPLADLYMPVVTPFIGDQALLVKQHMDQMKAQRVGNQLTSQGLDGDALSKETATRFTGIEKTDQAKIELIARNIVEVGYRKLYEGVAWLASHHQIDELEINVLGKTLKTDPSKWKYDNNLSTEIGLGAGDNDKVVENMTGLWNMSSQLKAEGSKLTDEQKRYNIASKLTKALELKDASLYFNNPEEPAEQLVADNEELNGMVLQQQEAMKQMSEQIRKLSALSEVEEIKAKQKGESDTKKALLGVAQLQEDSRQFNISTEQKAKEHNDDLAFDITELETKENVDIDAS